MLAEKKKLMIEHRRAGRSKICRRSSRIGGPTPPPKRIRGTGAGESHPHGESTAPIQVTSRRQIHGICTIIPLSFLSLSLCSISAVLPIQQQIERELFLSISRKGVLITATERIRRRKAVVGGEEIDLQGTPAAAGRSPTRCWPALRAPPAAAAAAPI